MYSNTFSDQRGMDIIVLLQHFRLNACRLGQEFNFIKECTTEGCPIPVDNVNGHVSLQTQHSATSSAFPR